MRSQRRPLPTWVYFPAFRHRAGKKGHPKEGIEGISTLFGAQEGKSLPQPKEENDDQYFTFPSFLRVWQEYKELSSEGGNTHRFFVIISLRFHIFAVEVMLVVY